MQVKIVLLSLVAAAFAAPAPRSGDGTFYTPGLGACGKTNTATDLIAAVAPSVYNSFGNPNTSKVCGKKAKISHAGKSVTVTVTDECPSCKPGDVDLSPAAFKKLATLAQGRIPITWKFL